jgi:NAD+ kinase
MTPKFTKIGVLGRHEDPRVTEPMRALVAHLRSAGVEVFASDSTDVDIDATRVPEARLAEQVELIIAVGGDGTMLYASGVANKVDVPLLGINRGRLGFLADITPKEMIPGIDSVLAGDYRSESRLMLKAVLTRGDGEEIIADALNDVVLQRRETGRMVDFETRIAGRYVNTHAGDGLIIATPTGSTAYALSCGGPIIEPGLDAVVIVPICPHTLTDRPIVISADESIAVNLLERDDIRAEVTVDGHSIGDIHPSDVLRVCRSDRRVTLIHPPGYDYYEILRSKLYWGRDLRTRGSAETSCS